MILSIYKKSFSFIILLFSLLLFSCEDKKKDTPTIEPATDRTILVYIIADNNLSSSSAINIKQMEDGIANGTYHGNLLVYVDALNEVPKLYKISKEKGKELVKTYPEQNSASAQIMGNVLKDAFNGYPASSNGLIMWSHGEGWLSRDAENISKAQSMKFNIGGLFTKWIGQDYENPESMAFYLGIPELRQALEQNAPKLDFMLFDACYMGSIEVAYELRNVTENLIASPTEIMASNYPYYDWTGFPYHQVMSPLFEENIDYDKIAYKFYSYYKDMDETAGQIRSASIGWIRTGQLAKLAQVTSKCLSSLDFEEDLYIRNSNSIQKLDRRSGSEYFYYDIKHYMETLANTYNMSSSLLSEFNTQLGAAIPVKYNTDYFINLPLNHFSGASTFIPTRYSSIKNIEYYKQLDWYIDAGYEVIPGF